MGSPFHAEQYKWVSHAQFRNLIQGGIWVEEQQGDNWTKAEPAFPYCPKVRFPQKLVEKEKQRQDQAFFRPPQARVKKEERDRIRSPSMRVIGKTKAIGLKPANAKIDMVRDIMQDASIQELCDVAIWCIQESTFRRG